MIVVAPTPANVSPGSTVCILVTGCPTVPVVDASFGLKSLPVRITGSKGAYMICVTLPRGEKGELDFRISSGGDTEYAGISVY